MDENDDCAFAEMFAFQNDFQICFWINWFPSAIQQFTINSKQLSFTSEILNLNHSNFSELITGFSPGFFYW